jgi:hypothetical protein
MAKFSKKVMGKEVGSAEVYAAPHTMSGKKVGMSLNEPTGKQAIQELSTSVGNISKTDKEVKTSGIKVRGTCAATKGLMARGPMA